MATFRTVTGKTQGKTLVSRLELSFSVIHRACYIHLCSVTCQFKQFLPYQSLNLEPCSLLVLLSVTPTIREETNIHDTREDFGPIGGEHQHLLDFLWWPTHRSVGETGVM